MKIKIVALKKCLWFLRGIQNDSYGQHFLFLQNWLHYLRPPLLKQQHLIKDQTFLQYRFSYRKTQVFNIKYNVPIGKPELLNKKLSFPEGEPKFFI